MSIDLLSPPVRAKLTDAKVKAMRGGSASVLTELSLYARENRLTPDERCHLDMTAAEVAYLDGDLELALKLMSLDGTPPNGASAQLRITLSDNRLMAQLLRPESLDGNEGRRNRDAKVHLTVSRHDFSSELVKALRSARSGKHFDALPQLRSYGIQAYWTGDWRLFRDSMSELSREYLALSDLGRAAYCAMLACDEDAIVSAATAATIVATNVRSTLTFLIEHGRLRQHARLVCLFIKGIADAIPDDCVDTTADYLLTWTGFRREFMTPLNVATAAWEALEAIGGRVSDALADRALDAAVGSGAWLQPRALERGELVDACAELVLKCSDVRLTSFVQEVATLARAEQRSHDYQNVLRLLWQISTRSQQAKDAVVVAMFPAGAPVAPSLLQLGRLLGRELGDQNELNAFAARIAERIRAQVTFIALEEPLPPAQGFGHFSFIDGDRKVVVEISNFGSSFEGLLAYVQELSEEAVKRLVGAMVEMIDSRFNLLTNRSALVHYLGRFAERMPNEDLEAVIQTLQPIARGEIVDVAEDTTGSASDPLNPFKFSAGKPSDLQGNAIVALSRLDKHHPGMATEAIQALVASGLAQTDADVRKDSYIAASWLSVMSASIVTGLLVGTKDGSPDAAAAALRVLASAETVSLDSAQIDYLLQSIHSASLSTVGTLRSDAATAVLRLKKRQLSISQRKSTAEIEARLQRDALYSVRSLLFEAAA